MGPRPRRGFGGRRSTRRSRGSVALLLACLVATAADGADLGSSLTAPALLAAPVSDFDPRRDIFAFPNGLLWEYGVEGDWGTDAADDGELELYQHCSQMSRAARQFFYAARFAPDRPRATEAEYAELVERVMDSDPRLDQALDDPIVIPGYADLYAFSADHQPLLTDALGGVVRAYIQRGNWRMIFPFSPQHQRRTAEALLADLERGHAPIVHIIRFPRVTVNHTLILYRAEATPRAIRFFAYDPNTPGVDIPLRYDRAEAEFDLGSTPYWAGGTATVYEIFHGWIY